MKKYSVCVYDKEHLTWMKVLETCSELEAVKIRKRLEKENKTVTIDYEEEK